jgi:hypothetical protein
VAYAWQGIQEQFRILDWWPWASVLARKHPLDLTTTRCYAFVIWPYPRRLPKLTFSKNSSRQRRRISHRIPRGRFCDSNFPPPRWNEHFTWDGAILIGRSAVGRATIDVLRINDPDRVEHRRLLIAAELWDDL